MMRESLCGIAQSLQVPAGVSLRAKKLAAQVIIHPMNAMSAGIIMSDCFGPNQSARSGNQHFHFKARQYAGIPFYARIFVFFPQLTPLRWLKTEFDYPISEDQHSALTHLQQTRPSPRNL